MVLFTFYLKKVFRKNYLIFVNIISMIAVFITATRSWFIDFTFSYLFILLLIPKFINKVILRYDVLISIFIIILLSTVIISNQLSNAFKRIDTITLLVKGDITVGGTFKNVMMLEPLLFGQHLKKVQFYLVWDLALIISKKHTVM